MEDLLDPCKRYSRYELASGISGSEPKLAVGAAHNQGRLEREGLPREGLAGQNKFT